MEQATKQPTEPRPKEGSHVSSPSALNGVACGASWEGKGVLASLTAVSHLHFLAHTARSGNKAVAIQGEEFLSTKSGCSCDGCLHLHGKTP